MSVIRVEHQRTRYRVLIAKLSHQQERYFPETRLPWLDQSLRGSATCCIWFFSSFICQSCLVCHLASGAFAASRSFKYRYISSQTELWSSRRSVSSISCSNSTCFHGRASRLVYQDVPRPILHKSAVSHAASPMRTRLTRTLERGSSPTCGSNFFTMLLLACGL